VLDELMRLEQEVIPQNQQYPGVPYWKVAARFGVMELEAHLRWAEEALKELHKMAGQQRSDRETRKEKKHAGK
jgi:hypothetical protein